MKLLQSLQIHRGSINSTVTLLPLALSAVMRVVLRSWPGSQCAHSSAQHLAKLFSDNDDLLLPSAFLSSGNASAWHRPTAAYPKERNSKKRRPWLWLFCTAERTLQTGGDKAIARLIGIKELRNKIMHDECTVNIGITSINFIITIILYRGQKNCWQHQLCKRICLTRFRKNCTREAEFDGPSRNENTPGGFSIVALVVV